MADRPLLAFQVHDGNPDEMADLVWAHDAADAEAFARRLSLFDDDTVTVSPIEIIAGTEPDAACVETRVAVLRVYGWHFEGDRFCDFCELPEMGGAFRVCSECDCCEECGHAPDCSEREEVDDGA